MPYDSSIQSLYDNPSSRSGIISGNLVENDLIFPLGNSLRQPLYDNGAYDSPGQRGDRLDPIGRRRIIG